jgi:hypothetical protein
MTDTAVLYLPLIIAREKKKMDRLHVQYTWTHKPHMHTDDKGQTVVNMHMHMNVNQMQEREEEGGIDKLSIRIRN